jgi:hypothetical protein
LPFSSIGKTGGLSVIPGSGFGFRRAGFRYEAYPEKKVGRQERFFDKSVLALQSGNGAGTNIFFDSRDRRNNLKIWFRFETLRDNTFYGLRNLTP